MRAYYTAHAQWIPQIPHEYMWTGAAFLTGVIVTAAVLDRWKGW